MRLQILKIFLLLFTPLSSIDKTFSSETARITATCGSLLSAENNLWLNKFPDKFQRVARLIPADARVKNKYYLSLKILGTEGIRLPGDDEKMLTFELKDSLKVNGYFLQKKSVLEIYFYFLQARAPNGHYYEAGQNPPSSILRGREILELIQGFLLYVDDFIAAHPQLDEIWVRTAEVVNIERLVPFLETYGFKILETESSKKNGQKYYRLVVEKNGNLKN